MNLFILLAAVGAVLVFIDREEDKEEKVNKEKKAA